ncbi:metal-dependent hydrolase [Haloarcula sp. 1CSR25-25]|uniref:metal-dependent hydrolase n=1 Tax=Haloarcula sp. 1CSR25-25 TaxID=2862545 RepID=UPI002895B0C2|nr:metal-dependent hydrolase [Haloarcula sp. 1CSR25-25]MDT3436331.1 metal-dependent hydrolase [Haloarcula sp. 1CSR25-25]
MMLPTHAIAGLAIAAPLLVLAPDHAAVALAGGLVGGLVPDLDLYSGHRRTLHYPSGYTLAAVPAVGFAAVLQTPLLVALAFVLMGAALHCRMDRYGGGLELRPWEATSERAVYDHVRGRWRSPKRWIQYDGAPTDAGLMVLVGAPLFVVLDGPFQWVVAVALATGATYALLRRRLATLAPVVFGNVPEPISAHVPDRYRQ